MWFNKTNYNNIFLKINPFVVMRITLGHRRHATNEISLACNYRNKLFTHVLYLFFKSCVYFFFIFVFDHIPDQTSVVPKSCFEQYLTVCVMFVNVLLNTVNSITLQIVYV